MVLYRVCSALLVDLSPEILGCAQSGSCAVTFLEQVSLDRGISRVSNACSRRIPSREANDSNLNNLLNIECTFLASAVTPKSLNF